VSTVTVKIRDFVPASLPWPTREVLVSVVDEGWRNEKDLVHTVIDYAIYALDHDGEGMGVDDILPSDPTKYGEWVERLVKVVSNADPLEQTKIAKAFQKVIDHLYA